MDNTEPAAADTGGTDMDRLDAAVDKLSRRLDSGADLPEEASGPALTEREAADVMGERRREREAEADRARSRAREMGVQVREMTDPIPIRLVNGRDPSLPPELEDGTRVNVKAGAGINMRQAAAVLGQARSQTDELRQQQAEELQSLFGDEAHAAPDASTSAQQAQPEQPQQPVEYSEEEKAAFRERYNAAVELEQARQARQQYEQALPQLLQTLAYHQYGEFGDVKSIADVERMARENPNRYLQWDLAQKKVAAVAQEHQVALQRQQAEARQQWQAFAKHHDSKAEELIPELKGDPAAVREIREASMAALKDAGFDESELRRSWNGQTSFTLRDARAQKIVADAARWRMALAAGREMQAKPLPPVMRPGVSQPRGSAANGHAANLRQQLAAARGPNAARLAAKLMAANRRGAR